MARKNRAEIELTAKDRTKRTFQDVNRRIAKFAGAAGIAGAAFAVQKLTRAGLQQIDILAKTSQKLGIATENLSALRLAAEKTGLTTKNLDLGIQRMTRRIAEAAAGTGEAVKALDELGLSAVDLATKSPDEQMLDLADAFEKVDGQSNKVRLGFKLFDSEGVALINTLELGREGLLESREAVERFGTAISAVEAKQVEEANDAFREMSEAVKGVGFDLARRFAPGMEAAAKSSTGFIVTVRRDFIPAMALLLEQMDLIVSNVRGLSDVELAVRVEVQQEELAELEARLEAAAKKAEDRFSSFDILGGAQSAIDAADTNGLEQQKAQAQARLDEVQAEQERRAEIIKAADLKLAEERAAQGEQIRIEAEEAAVEAEAQKQLRLGEIEGDAIKRRGSRAAAALKETSRELDKFLRDKERKERDQSRLEQRAAIETLRLRQSVTSQSIGLLNLFAGKNKRVTAALFIAEKGLAIGRTVVNTSAAAIKALAELGPIAGPPAAAAIKAAGAAEVATIAGTALTGAAGIGGGGAGGIDAGGFGGGGGFETAFETDPGSSGGTPTQTQGVVQLIFPSLFGITPEAIDSLADALRDASENRDIVVVSGTGRNADILNGANA